MDVMLPVVEFDVGAVELKKGEALEMKAVVK